MCSYTAFLHIRKGYHTYVGTNAENAMLRKLDVRFWSEQGHGANAIDGTGSVLFLFILPCSQLLRDLRHF